MSTSILQGGCLCGAVAYEIDGTPEKFYHCHCRRCRKATGSAHASNILIEDGTLRWVRGEDFVRIFKVPEAKRFARQFCVQCGSGLPRLVKETGFIVVPAGSLDNDVPIRPQARIFWDSRAPWSCGTADIPAFAEYPPG